MEALMPESKHTTRYPFKRFRREMYDLSRDLRDQASVRAADILSRPAKVYAPYITKHALTRATPKRDGLPGDGGPFGLLAAWLPALSLTELAEARAFVDSLFDRIEAEKCAMPICLAEAMMAQQEADALEEIAEKHAEQTGDWSAWIVAKEREDAAGRIARIAAGRVS